MKGVIKPITEQPGWLTGQILIAMPTLRDPRFAQSILLICAHTQAGAMGIILNKPLNRPDFAGLLQQLGIEAGTVRRDIRLGTGGPMENNRGFVLHSPDWTTEGSLDVDGTYMLTASLDILHAMAAGEGPKSGFLALGHSGWGPGQLDEEILQNAWLSAPADEALVYDGEHHTKWQRALAKLRINPAMLSGEAGRA